MADHKKPLGITLIAFYSALTALMLVPAGCAATLISPSLGGFTAIMGFLCTSLGILSCAVVYGLWTLQQWGRSLAYWLYLASIPLGIIAIFPPIAGPRATAGNTVLQLVGIIIDLFVIIYLSTPQTKELFSEPDTPNFMSVNKKQEPY